MRKLRTLWICGDSTGCFYYRAYLPVLHLVEKSARIEAIISVDPGGRMIVPLPQFMAQFDVIVAQRVYEAPARAGFREAKRLNPDLKIVLSLDDFMEALPETSLAYQLKVAAGHEMTTKPMRDLCDALIVSTSALREAYFAAPFVFRKPIHVCQNGLGPGWVPNAPPEKGVVCLWAGSAIHQGDFDHVIPALLEEMNTNPAFSMLFVGWCPPEIEKHPKVRYLGGWSWVQYPAEMSKLRASFGIAPLAHTPFNRCKSGVKLLEYQGLGLPGIYEDFDPYTHLLGMHDEIASTSEQWARKLSVMVEKCRGAARPRVELLGGLYMESTWRSWESALLRIAGRA